MSAKGGTLEQIVRELARLLQPLSVWVGNDRDFRVLLASLGLEVDDVAELATLRESLQSTLGVIGSLDSKIETLSEQLAAENHDGVRQTVTDLIADVEQAIGDVPALAAAIEQLSIGSSAHRQTVAAEMLSRLVELLIILHVEVRATLLHRVLRFLGVFDYTPRAANPVIALPEHDERRIQFARFGELLDLDMPIMQRLFGWGTPEFDAAELFARVSALSVELGLPFIDGRNGDAFLRMGRAMLAPAGDGLDLVFDITPDPLQTRFSDDLPVDLELTVEVQINSPPTIEFRPGQSPRLRPLSSSATSDITTGGIDLIATWPKASAPDEPIVILGELEASRLQATRIDAGVGLDFRLTDNVMEMHPSAFVRVQGGRLVIQLGEGDGFIQTLSGGGELAFDFDFGLGYSPEQGIHVLDGMGLEMTLPMHLQLGPIRLDELILAVSPIEEGVRIEASTTLGGDFGILQFAVERVGLNADLLLGQQDDKPLQFRPSFRPPNGVGVVVDASGVSGGGYLYFDHDRGEYAGVLELAFAGLNLQAIGLLSTQTPDGDSTFSFLAIITAQFSPGLQLGYGFTLNGVGGILGIQRATNVDVLREGLRNGTLGSVLFPEDPVANAPQLLQNLRSIFPSVDDRHLFGPVLAIGWGTPISILEIQLGVIVELPAPVRVILLGRITMDLPHKDLSIARLNLDILGVIDTGRQEIAIDASLYDSFVGIFAISGDMAMRLGYGSNPAFALSVGGFHPRFAPPANFPELRRLSISLGTGNNPRLRFEAYTALTSNTVQIGASIELYASAAGFSLEGGLAFDALFQFDPFGFIIDFRAYLAIKRGSTHILSLSAELTLSGVSPWRVAGRASFKILFIRISIPFSKTFGDEVPEEPLEQIDVSELLLRHLEDQGNWAAALPAGTDVHPVSLRDVSSGDTELLIHPLGAVTVLQKLAPLGIRIERFGQAVPVNGNNFELSLDVTIGTSGNEQTLTAESLTEHFAPSQFFDLSDDEKLENPSFEIEEAGLRFGGGLRASTGVSRVVNHEEVLIDKRQRQRYPLLLTGITVGFSRAEVQRDLESSRREVLSLKRNAGDFFGGRLRVPDPDQRLSRPLAPVKVREADHAIVDGDSLVAVQPGLADAGVTSHMRARDQLGRLGGGARGRRVAERFEVSSGTRIS